MDNITIERPSPERLEQLGVKGWSHWECGPSKFDWTYDAVETAYVLEGLVTVKTPDQEVEIKKGDLVRFPKGLSCNWHVKEKIRKVYTFS